MKAFGIALATIGFIFILFSCATSGGTVAPAPPKDVYTGMGESESLLMAMNNAKMDAVRKAVIDMIGPAAEEDNRSELDRSLYNTNNPNAFVYNETLETLRKDKIGDEFVYEISIRVNLDAIETVLDTRGITAGAVTSKEMTEQAAQEAVREATETTAAAEPAQEEEVQIYDEVTPEERRIIERYVDKMTYMVYFDEESNEDPFLMKGAVGIANNYLTSQALETIDLEQIERLKEDQRLIYEEETSQEVTIIQWVAQKLNADVYIEIDAITTGETRGSNYYGSANVTLKMYEASTGRLLGSENRNSPRSIDKTSEFNAKMNALQSSIYKLMPLAIDKSKGFMRKALERGIKYEMIVISTPDPRLMSRFRSRLRDRVKDLETVFSSAEETKYAVYLIGSIEDLEDTVYDVADTIPGLENMIQVAIRGKTITFDSGL